MSWFSGSREEKRRGIEPVVGSFGPSSLGSRSERAVSLSVVDSVLKDSSRVSGRILIANSESSHRETLVADL